MLRASEPSCETHSTTVHRIERRITDRNLAIKSRQNEAERGSEIFVRTAAEGFHIRPATVIPNSTTGFINESITLIALIPGSAAEG